MAEQIILNTDLYDNLLTERKGDYTAKPRITGTLYNTDIAARIVAARTEYQHGTILNILDMADSHKVQAIAEGKSVVDGVGQYLVNVQGAFEGEKAQFEPGKHALGITYTMGKLLRETLKLVKVVVNGVAAVGPVINTVTDSTSKAINGQLSSGGALVLGGVNLKIQGDDPLHRCLPHPHHRRGRADEGTRGDRQLALAGDRADADAGRRAVHREPHHAIQRKP